MDTKSYILQTKDYYSLVNLHKILLEAKFHPNPENTEVSQSPYTAGLYQQVANALLHSEHAAQWEDWLQLKNRAEYRQRAVAQLRACRQWKTATPQGKEALARRHLTPFLYTQDELAQVIAEVEQGTEADTQRSDAVFAKIETVTDKTSFLEFLNLLAEDNAQNPSEWENKTIQSFLEAMSAWIGDFSQSDYNDIDWKQPDYQTMAKVLYMGKLYE